MARMVTPVDIWQAQVAFACRVAQMQMVFAAHMLNAAPRISACARPSAPENAVSGTVVHLKTMPKQAPTAVAPRAERKAARATPV